MHSSFAINDESVSAYIEQMFATRDLVSQDLNAKLLNYIVTSGTHDGESVAYHLAKDEGDNFSILMENDCSLGMLISEQAINKHVERFPAQPNILAALLHHHTRMGVEMLAQNDYFLASKVHGNTLINAIYALAGDILDLDRYNLRDTGNLCHLFRHMFTKNLLEGSISCRDIHKLITDEIIDEDLMPECMVIWANPLAIKELITAAEDRVFMYALLASMLKENIDDQMSCITYQTALVFFRKLYFIDENKHDIRLTKIIKFLPAEECLIILRKLDSYPEKVALETSGILCSRISEFFIHPDKLPLEQALEMTQILLNRVNGETVSDLQFILHTLAARFSIELKVSVDGDSIIEDLLKKLKPYQKEGLTCDERLKSMSPAENAGQEDVDFIIKSLDEEIRVASDKIKKPRLGGV